jgi:nifR3 family TIM-barrel protein
MSQETNLKIGKLELGQGLILAPMAGITDLSFRRIAKSFGVDLVTSEMVSAEGLVRRNPGTWFLLESHSEEKPLAIQIFGSDSQVMAEAAKMVADEGADILDLNMGCPVQKVLRQGAGAALLRNIERVKQVVEAVRRAVTLPVTVKIRSGWKRNQINALEVARGAEVAGADAITIHPRTAKQGLSGTADWALIAKIKQAVTIPVIGNGDVARPEHVLEMRQLTKCDGVMIGRASMGNPWIFEQARQLECGEKPRIISPSERLAVMHRHLTLYRKSHHDRPSLSGLRSRLMWYTKGLPESARLRGQLGRWRQPETMIKVCEDFFTSLEKHSPIREDRL